jgi:6-pyruvoyl-tetrahydropterin synthase
MVHFFRRLFGPGRAASAALTEPPETLCAAALPPPRPAYQPMPSLGTSTATLPDDFWQVDEMSIIHPPQGFGYELALDVFFIAKHYVVMQGSTGVVHQHSYRVQVRCQTYTLVQNDQIVVGYHILRERIHPVVAAYNNRLLNELPVFQRLQATTENLTGVLFQQISRILEDLPIKLTSVTVWEAPTEMVTYAREARSVTLQLKQVEENPNMLVHSVL